MTVVDTRTGEIIEPSTDMVPASNMAALDALDPEDRERAVTRMLTEARSWLSHAVESASPIEISEFRAMVATVAESTRQLNLSKEIQTDAGEMVRRAERGLGQAIRKGQSEGTIGAHGRNQRGLADAASPPASPYDFADHSTLYGDGKEGGNGAYALADAPEEVFEEAVAEAKAERNVSRANVARKIRERTPKPSASANKTRADVIKRIEQTQALAERGMTSDQIARELGYASVETFRSFARDNAIKIPADELLGKRRRINPDRIVGQIIADIAHVDESLAVVRFDALDRDRLGEWISSLSESIKSLRRLKSNLEKELSR